MADPSRLDDALVAGRLARIDELLERLESTPGRTARDALQAARALTEVYGEALARALDRADAAAVVAMADDELLGHLMVLSRLSRAVERLRRELRGRGGDLELVGVDGGVARVRVQAKGCGSSTAKVMDAVRESLLAVAPELDGVEQEPDTGRRAAAFVPLGTVTRRRAQPRGTS